MDIKHKIILVWCKRDLRVRDHAPLFEALKMGREKHIPVVAMYSFEPSVTNAPDFSDFHRQCIGDALFDIQNSLKEIGVELLVFERPISDAFKYILERCDIVHVFSHEETGNSITYRRDIQMMKYLKAKNISWIEFPTNGVVRRL